MKAFTMSFGRLLKEGVYQEFEHKEALTELLKFKTNHENDKEEKEKSK